MIRKLITTLLCLLLTAALPLAALADTQHELEIIPGDAIAALPPAGDFCEALGLTFTRGEKSAALTLSISDTPIATVALGADMDALYVQSSLLGDDVFYVGWEDGFDFLENLFKAALEGQAAAGGTEVDEAAIEAVEQMLEAYKQQIMLAVAAGADGMTRGMISVDTPEEMMEKIGKIFDDDDGMLDFYAGLLEKITFEEGEFKDDERDTATIHMSMTLTGEDMAGVCDTQYMRNAMEMALKAENPTLEGEALDAMVEEALEEARKVYEDGNISIVLNVYAADGGETIVGMDMGMAMSVAGEKPAQAGFNMNYDRLTGENGENHRADLSITADGEELGQIAFQLDRGADGVSEGFLAMLVQSQQITFVYHGHNEEDQRLRTLDIYARDKATAIIEPAASDRPVIGFRLTSGQVESSVLDQIDDATPDTAINALNLSAKDLEALVTEIQARVTQAVFSAIANLPESVSQLFAGTMPAITIETETVEE